MVSKLKYRKGQTVCTKKGVLPVLKGKIAGHETVLRGTRRVPTNIYRIKIIGKVAGEPDRKLAWKAEYQLRKCPRKRRRKN